MRNVTRKCPNSVNKIAQKTFPRKMPKKKGPILLLFGPGHSTTQAALPIFSS